MALQLNGRRQPIGTGEAVSYCSNVILCNDAIDDGDFAKRTQFQSFTLLVQAVDREGRT
jgi:hypothetical protein